MTPCIALLALNPGDLRVVYSGQYVGLIFLTKCADASVLLLFLVDLYVLWIFSR